jgi:hypothetical protein
MKHGIFFYFGKIIRELEVLVVENHKLYFDRTHIFNVVLGFFSTKDGITL